MICKKCGTANSESAPFCITCGSNLKEEMTNTFNTNLTNEVPNYDTQTNPYEQRVIEPQPTIVPSQPVVSSQYMGNMVNTQPQLKKKRNSGNGIIIFLIMLIFIICGVAYYLLNNKEKIPFISNTNSNTDYEVKENNDDDYYYLTSSDYKFRFPVSWFDKDKLYGISSEPGSTSERSIIGVADNGNESFTFDYFFESNSTGKYGPEYQIHKLWSAGLSSSFYPAEAPATDDQIREKGPYVQQGDTYVKKSGCEQLNGYRLFWYLDASYDQNADGTYTTSNYLTAFVQKDGVNSYLYASVNKFVEKTSSNDSYAFTMDDIYKYAGEMVE